MARSGVRGNAPFLKPFPLRVSLFLVSLGFEEQRCPEPALGGLTSSSTEAGSRTRADWAGGGEASFETTRYREERDQQ